MASELARQEPISGFGNSSLRTGPEENAMAIYSHTQLSVFEECPQRYKFHYLDRVRKLGDQSAEAFVGSRVHETLQKLYDDLKCGKLDSLGELVAYYEGQWQRNWNAAIRIVRDGFSETHYHEYGVRCIQNYYQRYQPFCQSQTLMTEFHLVFPLDSEGVYQLQGYIDRLARRRDGIYEIHDYKTGTTLPSQAHADSDRQLALYQIGLQSCWKNVERVELIWHYVGIDSTLVSQRSEAELAELSKSTVRLIDRIESCRDFQPVKSVLCEWCEYRSQCPAWKHVVAVQAMSPQSKSEDDGVRLADAYAAAKRDLDSLTERFRTIREAIVEYARTRELNVLQGTRAQVSVRTRSRMAFPDPDTEAWQQMENSIKAAGRWEDVSELSLSRLTQALRGQQWPQCLIAEIEKFITARSATTVRASAFGGSEDNDTVAKAADEAPRGGSDE
jgi:putative RecB family exonuclease